MTYGPTLFDQGTDYASEHDPGTSHEAAANVHRLAPLLELTLDVITNAREHGATTGDVQAVAATLGRHHERGTIARRCTDLRNDGLIAAADRRDGRTVWVAARYAPTPGNVGEVTP